MQKRKTMTEQELLDLMESWENLNLIIHDVGNHPELLNLLMDVALNSNKPHSWRAAWMADKVHDNHPELLLPFLEKMIEKLCKPLHVGKKRQFLKLISLHDVPEFHHGFLVDYCLNALTSATEPPAVRVHAMQILFNISEKVPDLKPELLAVIQHELEYHATPGIRSRGGKLAKKLHQQIQINN